MRTLRRHSHLRTFGDFIFFGFADVLRFCVDTEFPIEAIMASVFSGDKRVGFLYVEFSGSGRVAHLSIDVSDG